MIDKKERIEINKKKAQYFFVNNIPIHISLKEDKWLNGYIKEVNSDYFIIEEFEEGKIPVFYIEILPNGIAPYREEEK